MQTLLLNGLTPDKANALASGIQPSWHAFFGKPQTAPPVAAAASPDVVAARVAVTPATTPAHRTKLPRVEDEKPRRGRQQVVVDVAGRAAKTGATQADARHEEADALPTSDTPWGKIALGLVGVAALVAAVVAFSGDDEPTAPATSKDERVAPAQTASTPAAPTPKPATPAPVADEPEPVAAEPQAKDPEPAEPEPTEPEPAEPAPVAEPAPAADPPPAAKPPTPRQPPPPPRVPYNAPKPTPKPGGIVRDAPF